MVMVRSMRGKMVDMDKLFKSNQNAIAVTGGGLKMNARGDIIYPNGFVKKVEQIEEEQKKIKKEREKISLTNSEKLKKFHLKRKFLTPSEIQENLRKITSEDKNNETKNANNYNFVENNNNENIEKNTKQTYNNLQQSSVPFRRSKQKEE